MIYVDDMLREASVPNGARIVTSRWSHLFCDSDDQSELHEFARKLGLRRSWFQNERQHPDKPEMWHYDVTEPKRERALHMGAVSISYPWGTAELMQRRIAARAAAAEEALDDPSFTPVED